MRRTRFMSWFFLVLSLAFFMVRDFRYALEAPLADSFWQSQFSMAVWMAGGPKPSRLENLYTLKRYASTEKLLALAEDAIRDGDSDFVAFAALNLPPQETRSDGLRLADAAIRLNPKLTWVYYSLGEKLMAKENQNATSGTTYQLLGERAKKLAAFDSDNAAPHLFLAQVILAQRVEPWPPSKLGPIDPAFLNALAQETDWRKEMDAAFSAPRYDSYMNRQFDLSRRVLRQRHWDHPAVAVTVLESTTVPNLLWVRNYTNLLVLKLGAEAEAKGRLNEAIDYYRRPEAFANRMRLQGSALIERLIAVACQLISHKALIPALKKAGRQSEAELVAYEDQQTRQDMERIQLTFAGGAHNDWSVLLVSLSAVLVVVFSLLATLLVVYVNAKRWIRKDKKGWLFEALTTAENYVPIILFASCLSLYLSFVPYASDFTHYMTTADPYSTFPPEFYSNMYPTFSFLEGSAFPAESAYTSYLPYAFGGLLTLTIVTVVSLLRKARSRA